MNSDLLTLRRALSTLQGEYRKMRKRERSEDTRHKIELGGLVIKASLGDEDRAYILGVLLTGNRRKGDARLREQMIKLGREALRQ
ncbi:conjugal transfer protein TraD [Martelella mediterranea]|uniref:conjugal transfer protein TraD n=1 Tax=Martelella mediterranea TaxID=293089 RepID=UPI002E7BDE5C|nr:conjugal transfer protein TraD [Martelella mediterranea]